MNVSRVTITALFVLLATGLMVWIEQAGSAPSRPGPAPAVAGEPLRIGLVPERDIFEQRRRYAAIADYLSSELHRPVELVTVRSYSDVLGEFRDRRIDGAFLGSLTAVLAVDQLGVTILARPQAVDGISTYRGVIFVPEASPVQSIDDLAGRSIVMVPTTTGSNLFPIAELSRRGILTGPKPPTLIYVGTHDDAILEVSDGHADAGAVKDRRLDEFEKSHPKFRRLATSDAVPENALVMRKDLPVDQLESLRAAVLLMHQSDAGRTALATFGASRFLPTGLKDYAAIYDLCDLPADVWKRVDPVHPAPRRPATAAGQ
jgi:phosphonate transport system substrate-binding protein